MHRVNLSEFRKLNRSQIESILPVMIQVDGNDFVVVDKPDDVMIMSDLHIRIRNNLRAQERKARFGMPEGTKVYADMFEFKEEQGD